METQNEVETIEEVNTSQPWIKKRWKQIGFITGFDLIAFIALYFTYQAEYFSELMFSIPLANFIVNPVLAALLGSLFALFGKEGKYSQRFYRNFLTILFILQILTIVLILVWWNLFDLGTSTNTGFGMI